MKLTKSKKDLIRDFIFIVIGAFLAFSLARLGFIDWIVDVVGNVVVSSFLSGIFFTSIFSIAPSAVALSHIEGSVYVISFWGALGALCGDLILFYFIRDRFSDHLIHSFRPSFIKDVLNSFHLGFMRWLAPIIGALIIASPLPDELGLTLLGMSKTKVSILIPVAFIMNFIGIFLLLDFINMF